MALLAVGILTIAIRQSIILQMMTIDYTRRAETLQYEYTKPVYRDQIDYAKCTGMLTRVASTERGNL